MRCFVIAAIVLLGCFSAHAEEKLVKFQGREWTVSLPDTKFSIAKSDGENGIVLADRGYLITDWKSGGVLDVDLFFIEKPYLTEEGQQASYAPHLSIGLRTKGEFQPERSFELKGEKSLRLRLAGGQVLYEKPAQTKGEDSTRLADKRFTALKPYQWHHLVIRDCNGKICVCINGTLVLEESIDAPTAGNKLMIGVRENNAGQNLLLVRPHR